MAALVLLGAQGLSEGEATLVMDPNSTQGKGTWENWIGDTVEWTPTNQWFTMDQAPVIRSWQQKRGEHTQGRANRRCGH